MAKNDELRYGAPGENAVHICVDMQRLFAEKTDWHTPWMGRVLPNAVRLAAHRPEQTVFTRFIPADKPGDGEGTWRPVAASPWPRSSRVCRPSIGAMALSGRSDLRLD